MQAQQHKRGAQALLLGRHRGRWPRRGRRTGTRMGPQVVACHEHSSRPAQSLCQAGRTCTVAGGLWGLQCKQRRSAVTQRSLGSPGVPHSLYHSSVCRELDSCRPGCRVTHACTGGSGTGAGLGFLAPGLRPRMSVMPCLARPIALRATSSSILACSHTCIVGQA